MRHVAGAGEARVSFAGGQGVDRALRPDPAPPQKGQDPQNPTESDPRAPEVTPTQKSEKKTKMGFWNQRVEGVQKSHHLPYIWWKKTNIDAFGARVHNN